AGIVLDQELLWSEGFGYSDLGAEVAATDSTIYSICSISKLFTSIAILQLRDQGKLDLDDELQEHLPWFNLKQAYEDGGPITIRSLLTHSSGLPRESDYPYWTDPTFPFPTSDQIKEKLGEQETLYPPSTYFQYSNLGMALLGEVVAELSGMPYEDYIQKNILGKLNLKDTRPEMPEALHHGQLATGYSIESREGEREELAFFQARGIAPAAGFSSTVKDLAAFASWQFRALEEKDAPVLNGNTLREMQRVHWMDPDWETSWGLGFVVSKTEDNKTVVGHSGGCPGYLTQLWMIPSEKAAFIVMVNGLGVNVGRYATSMRNIFKAYEKAKEEEEVPEVNLEDYAGKYYGFWAGEALAVSWKGKLAVFYLRSQEQKKPALVMKHKEEDTFYRLRDDGEPGEEIRFERNAEGKVVRMWRHSSFMDKVGGK
ncbi:MAG: serine hydrolase, partial [Phaeodactylibacter sp.]|nr:serine hydrolase [Phaeodactylibacter sp.]